MRNRIGCCDVQSSWRHWPCLFPQHGRGPKHRRTIVLEEWQIAIIGRYPRRLLRGLIHSDGCRVMNRVQNRRYEYPRYFFSNESTDILQIVRDTCDVVGIRYRDTRRNAISVARRLDVARMDAFVGAKR